MKVSATDAIRFKDVVEILGLSPSRVHQMIQSGDVQHEMTPLGRLYSRAQVEALAAERERKAA